MAGLRPNILVISGFDPSAGAGILSDTKCIEQLGAYALGVCSALTVQNDIEFLKAQWTSPKLIFESINTLNKRFTWKIVKIGIIENFELLQDVIKHLLKIQPDSKIIWDPILRTSSGFDFHTEINHNKLLDILHSVEILTPNAEEILKLQPSNSAFESAEYLSKHTNILLKGGHLTSENKGKDFLFGKHTTEIFPPNSTTCYPKHGSGCVFSSSLAAYLAHGDNLNKACRKAKYYTEYFLSGNHSLLGYHAIR